MLTDDYTLAILPLARLACGIGKPVPCCAEDGRDWTRYREVLETGVRGYRLYTYHGLVRDRYGAVMADRVRDRHIRMFVSSSGLEALLEIIDSAVGIGAMTTPTRLGEIKTPVELNVALALLLGLPGSPYYTTRPEQRHEQTGRITPDLDRYFADCLTRARREMVSVSGWLMAMLDTANDSVTVPDNTHPSVWPPAS